MDTERVAGEFIARSLPKSDWTHEAHLLVGLWHVLRYSDGETLDLLRTRIRAYNEATGVANTQVSGYHETITRFYVWVIRDFLAAVDRTRGIDDLAQELLARFGDRNLPLRHYTKERLFSPQARLAWLEPDLTSPSGA